MLRFTVVVALAVTLFAVTVRSTPREELTETLTNLGNSSEIKNDTQTDHPSVKSPREEDVADSKQNKTGPVELVEQVSGVNDSVKKESLKGRTNCHSDKEQYDMVNCIAILGVGEDDDDESAANSTESTMPTTSDKSISVKVPDTEKDSKTIKEEMENWLKKRKYGTDPEHPEQTELPKNSNVSETSSVEPKTANAETETPVSSVAPLVVGNARSVEEVGNIEESIESRESTESKSMPSGVIALVTAVTFAILIVVGYVSMVAWKRYLEYRYGHRELLVNDMEFDTNDLRHFEL